VKHVRWLQIVSQTYSFTKENWELGDIVKETLEFLVQAFKAKLMLEVIK